MGRIRENVQRAATATMGADSAQIITNPSARQQAIEKVTTTDDPFARPNIDLGTKTTETSDIDLENVEYSPESGEFITPEITQLRGEIEELRKKEEELQENINNPSVEGMSSSREQVSTDAKKRYLGMMDNITKQISVQEERLRKINNEINTKGADSDSLKELGTVTDKINSLKTSYEEQKAHLDGTIKALEHRNETRGSIEYREKKIEKAQKKLKDFAEKYKYLNEEDPLVAAQLGSAIEQSQSKRSVKFVPFSEKSKDFLDETLGIAMYGVENLGDKNYGLFELGKGLKPSEKSISVSDIEEIRNNSNGVLGTSADGITLMYNGKAYLVKTSDSAIEAANQIYPKLNSFLGNYRSNSISEPITFTTSTQESLTNENILEKRDIGETIVDLPNITIRGVNIINSDKTFWKKIVIDIKNGYPISFTTNANDEAALGERSSEIMKVIDNLIIDGTLRGTARTAVKDRPLN